MEKQIASVLLKNEAVFLRPNEPFTWASGIQSPIYCDNRLMLSFPNDRELIVDSFVAKIKEVAPDTEVIMGTATAGIPWAALIAAKLGLPMGYVRSSNKSHGKENKIEGKVEQGQKVVVIEDLISTGGSVRGAVEALRDTGATVSCVLAIFTYGLSDSDKLFKEIDCPLHTLSNYDVLSEEAVAMNYIDSNDLTKLKAWKLDPHDHAWMKK